MVSRTNKFRGSQTHGKGKKAGRGAGKRGGKGNAGLHKHRWLHCVKFMPDHFGAHGFKRPQKVVGTKITLNISDLDRVMDHLGVEAKDGVYELDLTGMGIDKLLGKGTPKKKYKITVGEASAKAVEKVQEAGGEIIVGPAEEAPEEE